MRKFVTPIILLGFLGISVFLISVGAFFFFDSKESSSQPLLGALVTFPNGVVVTVGVADSQVERTRGLSGRESLGEQEGLLFLHEDKAERAYWMREMLFPIDIIWIDGNRIVGFIESAQPEEPPLTLLNSPAPVDKVLEVKAGFVRENTVNVGEFLDIRFQNQ